MQVIVTPKASKQYAHLTKLEQAKIKKRLLVLEKNAYEGKKLSGSLVGIRSLRVWPYRILYTIDEKQRKLYIVTIAHRQGVYN